MGKNKEHDNKKVAENTTPYIQKYLRRQYKGS
jgi:hypothetical protein